MKIGKLVRRILYKILPLEAYLRTLSRMYFISFNLGLLKNNWNYAYPYFLKNIIKPGNICIDIGANLGYLTVLFAKLVGKQGKVYAVEPIKPILAVLRKNTKAFGNVEIVPYALGLENKKISLGNNTVKKQGFLGSGSHFVLDAGEGAQVEFEAEMRQGSQVFSQLEKLDFIKCDIEGFETVVLSEMEAIILKFEPLLLVETKGEKRKEMLDFFRARNYEAYTLEGEKLFIAKEEEAWDILFVPKSKTNSIEKYLD